jgi:hypothetical protein
LLSEYQMLGGKLCGASMTEFTGEPFRND